ncbi:MAG: 2-oxoacid:acceptor oxidoreductase family protein [Chitinispirillales bacterium]|jgi:pyruvate ferredoxin oxidoreductase gamma subunit|nr:2-oxoacid:acceptor oxidoreductase family protein [Chitinispirillales bacterium]
MSDKNIDIRMAGLGGQGVVTAAHILGTAVVSSGKYAVVNPFFGAEKRLAPTESYVRTSNDPIYDRGEILYPDIIMVFAPEVITLGKSHTMPFYSGLKKGGTVLINSQEAVLSEKDRAGLDQIGANVSYVPASKLAVEFTGTALATNMTMLGALCGAVTDLVSLELVLTAVEERFSGKTKVVASGTSAALDEALKNNFEKNAGLIEKNRTAINKAFEFTKGR